MTRKRKTDAPSKITVQLDSETQAMLNSDEGQDALAEMIMGIFGQHTIDEYTSAAAELSDGPEKDKNLQMAELLRRMMPGETSRRQMEFEQYVRESDARKQKEDAAIKFVAKELNRLRSLPEPVFLLNLPDDVIKALVASQFDTVGKVLFGVQVESKRLFDALLLEPKEDIYLAFDMCRERLLNVVDSTGYNLLGSRLMQHGYLQRDYFTSQFKA